MFRKIVLCVLGLTAYSCLNASPIFQVTQLNTLQFPSQMFVNYPGLADYSIKNTSTTAQQIYLRLPAIHFTQIASTSAQAPSCPLDSGFTLNSGASCVLRLSYQSDQPISFNQTFPTVCPFASPDNHGCADGEPATVFTTSDAPTNLASFHLSDDQLTLTPNATTQLTVVNNSDVTANNVSLKLPAALQSYLTQISSTQCNSIAPGDACSFKLNMSIHMPVNDLSAEPITLQGSNVAPQIIPVHLAPMQQHPITITTAAISQPSADAVSLITVHNDSDVSISQMTNTLAPPAGVSLDVDASTCKTSIVLAPEDSCDYAYIVSADAMGDAVGNISYVPDQGSEESQAVSLKVDTSQIALSATNDDATMIPAYSSGVITVKNTGVFTLQHMQLYKNLDNDWFTITGTDCAATLAPGVSCAVNYSSTGKQGDQGYFTVSADNADQVQQDLIPISTLVLSVDHASVESHLGYAALKVANLTDDDYRLTNIHAAPTADLANHLVLCDAQASQCDDDARYQSSCLAGGDAGTVLPKHATCYLWYQVQKGAIDGDHTGQLQVSLDAAVNANRAAPIPFNYKVNVTYGTNLYASGYFYSAGDQLVANIAQWNGASWSALSSRAPGRYDEDYAMQYFHGDLILGGLFDAVHAVPDTSNIALWNGYHWKSIGGANGRVAALAILNNHLYAGGLFTQIGSVAARNVAQLTQSSAQPQWNALSGADNSNGTSNLVTSLQAFDGRLIVGGSFSKAGSISSPYVASWVPTSSQMATGAWQALGDPSVSAPNGIALAFATYNQQLYMGGYFDELGSDAFGHLAAWNGSDWLNVPNNVSPGGTDGVVEAITSGDDALYVAGAFKHAYSDGDVIEANGVAAFDPVNQAWKPLVDNGVNGVNGGYVSTLLYYNHKLYVAGTFSQAGTAKNSHLIAQWDGQHFTALGDGITKSFSENFEPFVLSLTVAPHLSMQDAS